MWVKDASSALILQDGATLGLVGTARPQGDVRISTVEETGLGSGVRAQSDARIDLLGLTVRVEVTLFEKGPHLSYRLVFPSGPGTVAGVVYLDGTLFPESPGSGISYLTDNDFIEAGMLDQAKRGFSVGQGKPLLLRDRDGARGLLMAIIDPSDAISTVQTLAIPRGVAFQWQKRLSTMELSGSTVSAPRLFVRVVDADNLNAAFDPYRTLMQELHPPAPVPDWFRHQWISWYLYGMDIDEGRLKSQIDFIAEKLNDVGPWSILIDAGWYLAEGQPNSGWRVVDNSKFPSGLRALVDYAHAQGVKVVLYFSASYLDDREESGNWLGLKGIIEQHPEWLVEIQSGDLWKSYYYDYSNPGFQQYLRDILQDYFVQYGVDGIKVDGLEDSRLAIERGVQRGLYSAMTRPILPTTSLYAFIYRESVAIKPDVYLEAGWRMPAFSASHFTLARQSDDTPDFESGYPAPGLQQHVDYAIAQRVLLGQRPHLGNYWGDPNNSDLGLQWLEAGLAMNAPVVLGFDLPSMSPQAVDAYRARLSMLRPFSGEVHVSELWPESFSSTSEGTTFLALFNRTDQMKTLSASLPSHGLPQGVRLWGYDVAADRPVGVTDGLMASVQPRTLQLFVLRSEPGMLWTNSSYHVELAAGLMRLVLNGPDGLPGYAYVATPEPTALLVNGQEAAESSWSYDKGSGVLKIAYPHNEAMPAVVEIWHP